MQFRAWISAVPFALGAAPAHAHAFAQRYDLPLPLWLYLIGAGAAVALSFIMVELFVRRGADSLRGPRLELLQTAFGRSLAHPLGLFLIRLLSVALFVLLIAAGLFGTQGYALDNILPTAVWVVWWIGLAFFSALLGDICGLINPWRIMAEWAARAWPRAARTHDVPAHAAVWPAAGLFICFTWAELVWPDRSVPASLAGGVLVYSAVTWLGMYRSGIEAWLRRGETFSILFGLFARFGPIELRVASAPVTSGCGRVVDASDFRRADPTARRICLRPYGVGLLTKSLPHLSMLAFIRLVLSTVSFDGFADTPAWQTIFRATMAVPFIGGLPNAIGLNNANGIVTTLGIVLTPVIFLAIYIAFCWLIAKTVPANV